MLIFMSGSVEMLYIQVFVNSIEGCYHSVFTGVLVSSRNQSELNTGEEA
jgi:hypothetical protein